MLTEFGKASNDFAKAASNAIILTNGAAATAILAGTGKTLVVAPRSLMLTLIGYAIGVIFGALMLFFMSLCNDAWDGNNEKQATRYWYLFVGCFCCGMACFVISSSFFGIGLLRQ